MSGSLLTRVEQSVAPSRKRLLGLLIGLQICLFMCALDQTVLNTALPAMTLQLHGEERGMWVISAYLLFSTVFTPIAGKLCDLFPLRQILLVCVALFTLASALCGAAGFPAGLGAFDAIDQLVLARCLQGSAGGAMLGVCFVSVGRLFSLSERGRLQGLLAASFIVAALLGPTCGGWLVQAFSWRLIFNLNIPLGVAALILLATALPAERLPARAPNVALLLAKIDGAGIISLILCVFPMILASGRIGGQGAVDVVSACLCIFSLVMFLLFLNCEGKAREPLLPLKLFADRQIMAALLTVFVSGIGMFGSLLIFALLLQEVMAIAAWQSGLYLTPLMLVVAGASIASGINVSKSTRYKRLLLLGLAAMSSSSFLLFAVTITAHPGADALLPFLLSAAIGGIGLGLLLPLHTIVMQSAVTGDMIGVGITATQFSRSLGGTVGTGVMSALMVGIMKHASLAQAAGEMFFIYGVIVALLLLVNAFLPEIELQPAFKQSDLASHS